MDTKQFIEKYDLNQIVEEFQAGVQPLLRQVYTGPAILSVYNVEKEFPVTGFVERRKDSAHFGTVRDKEGNETNLRYCIMIPSRKDIMKPEDVGAVKRLPVEGVVMIPRLEEDYAHIGLITVFVLNIVELDGNPGKVMTQITGSK